MSCFDYHGLRRVGRVAGSVGPDVGGDAKAERGWRAFVHHDLDKHMGTRLAGPKHMGEVKVGAPLLSKLAVRVALCVFLARGLQHHTRRQGDFQHHTDWRTRRWGLDLDIKGNGSTRLGLDRQGRGLDEELRACWYQCPGDGGSMPRSKDEKASSFIWSRRLYY